MGGVHGEHRGIPYCPSKWTGVPIAEVRVSSADFAGSPAVPGECDYGAKRHSRRSPAETVEVYGARQGSERSATAHSYPRFGIESPGTPPGSAHSVPAADLGVGAGYLWTTRR